MRNEKKTFNIFHFLKELSGLSALFFIILFVSCPQFNRDNPFDPNINTLPDSIRLIFPVDNSNFSGSSVTFSWDIKDNLPGLVKYALYLSQTIPPTLWPGAENLDAPSYVVNGLTQGIWYWRVRAIDVNGSVESKIYKFSTKTLFINAPKQNEIVNNASIPVSGYVLYDGSQAIELEVNGVRFTSGNNWSVVVTIPSRGLFSINIILYIGGVKKEEITLTVDYNPDAQDMTPPAIQITSPEDWDTVGTKKINLFGTAVDGGGIASLKLGNTSIGLDQLPEWVYNQYSLPFDSNEIIVTATDNSGNSASHRIHVFYSAGIAVTDNIPPELDITDPAQESTVVSQPLLKIGGTADDPGSGVLRLTVDTQTFIPSGFNWEAQVDLTNSQGVYKKIVVTAVDNKNNTATANLFIKYDPEAADTEPPVINIKSPPNFSPLDMSPIDVSGEASDNKGIASVTVNGIAADYNPTLGVWSVQVPISTIQKAQTAITAVAKDAKGLQSSDVIYVSYDSSLKDLTKPTISYRDNTVVDENPVIITLDVSDLSGINDVIVNGKSLVFQGGTLWSEWFNLTLGPNNTFTAVAHDASANKNEVTYTFSLEYDPTVNDFQKPSIQLVWPGDTVTQQTVNIKVQVTDVNGVENVKINGITPADLGAGYYERQNVELNQGPNTITVTANDGSRNKNFASETFFVTYQALVNDTQGPTIFLRNPVTAAETVMTTPINVEVEVNDESGVETVWIKSVSVAKDQNGYYSSNVSLSAGTNAILVKASDINGYLSEINLVISYFLPPNKPQLYVPLNNAKRVHKVVDFQWTGSHPNNLALTYEVYLADEYSNLGKVTTTNQSTYLIPYNLSLGELYRWQIIAYDSRGQSAASDISEFQVNHAPYIPSSPFPANNSKVSLYAENTTLSWSGGDADAGDQTVYDIYFGTADLPQLNLIDSYRANPSYLLTSGLNQGETYAWEIVAKDLLLETAKSPRWYFKVNNPPDVPSNAVPNTGFSGKIPATTSVNLFWQGNDPDGEALTYDLYFFNNNQGWTHFGPFSTPAFYNMPVSLGVLHAWYVVARDGYDSTESYDPNTGSGFPFFITVNTPPDPASGQSPYQDEIISSLATGVTLSWSGSDVDSDALYYDVWVAQNDAGMSNAIKIATDIQNTSVFFNLSLVFQKIRKTTTPTLDTTQYIYYYWKVDTKDQWDATNGAVWYFSQAISTNP